MLAELVYVILEYFLSVSLINGLEPGVIEQPLRDKVVLAHVAQMVLGILEVLFF